MQESQPKIYSQHTVQNFFPCAENWAKPDKKLNPPGNRRASGMPIMASLTQSSPVLRVIRVITIRHQTLTCHRVVVRDSSLTMTQDADESGASQHPGPEAHHMLSPVTTLRRRAAVAFSLAGVTLAKPSVGGLSPAFPAWLRWATGHVQPQCGLSSPTAPQPAQHYQCRKSLSYRRYYPWQQEVL